MEKENYFQAERFEGEDWFVPNLPSSPLFSKEGAEAFADHLNQIQEQAITADRAAMHKEILAKEPKKATETTMFPDETHPASQEHSLRAIRLAGYNQAILDYRKAIDEVFSSKE